VNAVTVTSTTHGIYTVCTFIYNAITSTPHSCWLSAFPAQPRTSVRKLHTLMRKCLLPQHSHNSTVRPASPRPLRRPIPRQSLACPATRRRRRRRGSNYMTKIPNFKNSRWRTAAILKMVLSLYLSRKSSNLNEFGMQMQIVLPRSAT